MIASPPVTRSFARSLLLFTLAETVLVALVALLLSRFVWTDAEAARTVHVSAIVAAVVQVLTFAVARLVAREQVIAGWGVGVLLRFLALAVWGFLGVKALALVAGPALLSLVLFFFVTTLVEPFFLNT